jgi:lipopolysaccharide biosynthesis glycosyltransferase
MVQDVGMRSAPPALVLAADERFAFAIGVALFSALRHLPAGSPLQVYVLDNGLSAGSRAAVARIAERAGRSDALRWVALPPERLARIPISGRLRAAAYARLLITELVDADVERVVYLDADVLVRGDLSPLWRLDLGGAVIGAVPDTGITRAGHGLSAVRERAPDEPYYNTGVLLIDVPGWRATGLALRALDFASRGVLRFADQDALNAVVERWQRLDETWNLQVGNIGLARRRLISDREGYRRERIALKTATILHFTGPAPRPWEPACESPRAREWARAFTESGWHTRRQALAWRMRWTLARASRRPAIAVARWRARFASARRAVRR